MGGANIWAIDSNNTLYSYDRYDDYPWTASHEEVQWVSAAADSTTWCIDSAGHILWRFWEELDWVPLAGQDTTFSEVAVIDAKEAWVVTTSGNLHHLKNGVRLADYRRGFQSVSAATDGTVWGITSLDQINYLQKCPPQNFRLNLKVDTESKMNYGTLGGTNANNGYVMTGVIAIKEHPATDCYPGGIQPGTVFLYPSITIDGHPPEYENEDQLFLNCKRWGGPLVFAPNERAAPALIRKWSRCCWTTRPILQVLSGLQ